jgi:heptosyltransferase-1
MRWPRSRELCARALGYELPRTLRFGLRAGVDTKTPCVAFVHGTSRDDKCWPEAQWLELGRRLIAQGFTLGLPHGNEPERERVRGWPRAGPASAGVAAPRPGAAHRPTRGLRGVIGVDSGLSHIAVALDLPHVQIYNFDTAWRTGPPESHSGPPRSKPSTRSPLLPRTQCGGMAAGASDS